MGRFLRSVLVVFGVLAILKSESVVVAGFGEAPVARVAMIGFGLAMQLMAVGFIALLQSPFFPRRPDEAAPAATPLRGRKAALCVLFGLLQLYPGVGALLIGFGDARDDAFAMRGLGVAALCIAFAFVAGGLSRLLRAQPDLRTLED